MIGIHECAGSFSDRWIEYCTSKGIPFRRVNCLSTDVVQECDGLGGLLWHWAAEDPRSVLVAQQVLASLQAKGLVVFPNIDSCWHYDDKVGQKYLLEAIGAPLIPTWVFTSKAEAEEWIRRATWPKVFKLRCGSASKNVRLVRTRAEAEALCRRAFGAGFPAVSGYLNDMQTRARRHRTLGGICKKLRGAPRMVLLNLARRRHLPRQRDYLYFQEFLPGNSFDTRIVIIGDRAFGARRANRPNDFRASGSGVSLYEPEGIDRRCVGIAFKVTERLAAQSLAFDFLFNSEREPMISEISYCYPSEAFHGCAGYWDHEGNWHKGRIWAEDAILEDLLAAIEAKAVPAGPG